jgi:hypothetical protein
MAPGYNVDLGPRQIENLKLHPYPGALVRRNRMEPPALIKRIAREHEQSRLPNRESMSSHKRDNFVARKLCDFALALPVARQPGEGFAVILDLLVAVIARPHGIQDMVVEWLGA